jgi:predicted transcriptional regulator
MNPPENIGGETEFSVLLNSSRGAASRKKILNALLLGTKNCRQTAKAVGLNWHTTNRHLQILLKEGLVKRTGFGQKNFFKVTQRGVDAMKSFQESN